MTTLVEYFHRQSRSANWSYSDQLCGSDGNPLWGVTPIDLVITMALRDRKGVDQLTLYSTDSTSQLVAADNGMMNVNITPTTLVELAAGDYVFDIELLDGTDVLALCSADSVLHLLPEVTTST